MAIWARKRKEKTAKNPEKRDKIFTVSFKDLTGNWKTLSAYRDKRASEKLEEEINKLIALKKYPAVKDADDKEFVNNFLTCRESRILERLAKLGIIGDGQAKAGKSITEHIDDFYESHDKITNSHKEQRQRLVKIARDCGWNFIGDISQDGFKAWRTKQQETGKKLSAGTLNNYHKSLSAFCNWLCNETEPRLSKNPLSKNLLTKLDRLNEEEDRRRIRREFSDDELTRLRAASESDDQSIQGLGGIGRSLFYRTALVSGFRHRELASRTIADFELDLGIVRIDAQNAKGRRSDTNPLDPDLIPDLRKFMAGRSPSELV